MKLRSGIDLEVVGRLEVNCYLVTPPGSRFLYIIDPGDDADDIAAVAAQLKYEEAIVLLTHAHVDHISALGGLVVRLGVKKVYLHEGDHKLYHSKNNHLLPFVALAENLPEISWPPAESADFKWIHTPGHSKGGACYHFPKLNALFTGDTLFHCSVGRTDFPGGDHAELMDSITNVLFKFPDDTEIFPGHGDTSSIGGEKATNPYVG